MLLTDTRPRSKPRGRVSVKANANGPSCHGHMTRPATDRGVSRLPCGRIKSLVQFPVDWIVSAVGAAHRDPRDRAIPTVWGVRCRLARARSLRRRLFRRRSIPRRRRTNQRRRRRTNQWGRRCSIRTFLSGRRPESESRTTRPATGSLHPPPAAVDRYLMAVAVFAAPRWCSRQTGTVSRRALRCWIRHTGRLEQPPALKRLHPRLAS
jgi:hypothetical protein